MSERIVCQNCGLPALTRRNPDGERRKIGDACGRESGRMLPCPGVLITWAEYKREVADEVAG